MKNWYCCPYCGKKLLKYNKAKAQSKGIYYKCKNCKREIEIKIDKDK